MTLLKYVLFLYISSRKGSEEFLFLSYLSVTSLLYLIILVISPNSGINKTYACGFMTMKITPMKTSTHKSDLLNKHNLNLENKNIYSIGRFRTFY